MNLLLDTHVWIWAENAPEKLNRRAQRLITNDSHINYLSSISVLELARLSRMGMIELDVPLSEWINTAAIDLHINSFPVNNDIAVESYSLPGVFHADPADRIIVATARQLNASLLTADERILSYEYVESIDVRA